MEQLSSSKPGVWFWAIASLALVWNLLGVGAYIAQMTMSPEAIAALPAAEKALYDSYPAWAAGAFALAVWGGALGCLLLLLRKKIATPVFGASLAGIAVQMFHSFFIANSIAVYGPGAALMPTMVVVVGVALFWWSTKLKQNRFLT